MAHILSSMLSLNTRNFKVDISHNFIWPFYEGQIIHFFNLKLITCFRKTEWTKTTTTRLPSLLKVNVGILLAACKLEFSAIEVPNGNVKAANMHETHCQTEREMSHCFCLVFLLPLYFKICTVFCEINISFPKLVKQQHKTEWILCIREKKSF